MEKITVRPAKEAEPVTTGTPYGMKALESELAVLKKTAKGSRNSRLNAAAFSLGQLVAGGELQHNQVVTSLLAVALEIGLKHDEASATITSGIEAGAKEPRRPISTPASSPFNAPEVKFGGRDFDLSRLTPGSVIAAGNYSISYVVDRLIPENSITLFYAKGGSGKSTLATQFGAAVKSNKQFMGRATVQRPVVVIDFENPLAVLKKRVNIIEGADEVLFWTGSNPPQLNKPEWEELKELITTLKNPLIIFDTLSSACSTLDILSNKDFAPIMQRIVELRNIGATIVLLHHTPKSDETKYIGASCIYNQCDHILAMYPVRSAGTEKEVNDEDDTKVYRLGTKDKTRFEHFKMYIVFDEDKGLFIPAEDPDNNILSQIQNIICSLEPVNQSILISQIGSSISKNKIIRLLKNNEGHLWFVERGENNAKLYRSMRLSGSLFPA